MATSGSFNTNIANTYFGNYYLEFSWTLDSQDAASNASKINWEVILKSSGGLPCLFSSGSVSIDGTVVFQRGGGLVAADSVVASGTTSVVHNSDGTKSFTAKVDGASDNFDVSITGSKSFELPSIARASEISSAQDTVLGNACIIRWTPASSSYKFKIRFSLGNWSYTTGFISPNKTSTHTYSGYVIPLEVANQIPRSKTGTMTAVLYTYSSDGTQLGSSQKTFTVTVPQSLGPEISMAVSSVNELSVLGDFSSLFIQGRSKAKIDFSGTAGQYGTNIASIECVFDGKKYTMGSVSSFDSDYISSYGTIQIKGTATDERGFSATATQEIEVLSYSAPAVIPYSGSKVICQRENGTQLRIEAGKKFSSLGGENLCSLSFRYARSGTSLPSEWTEILSRNSSSDRASIIAAGVTLDQKTSYTVEIKAEDDVGETNIITLSISTDSATFHLKRGGRGAAFGKYAEEDDLLDVEWDAKFHGKINGMFFKILNLSTAQAVLSMEGGAQTVVIFGGTVYGTLYFSGAAAAWSGVSGVSCSNSGNTVTVNLPASGSYILFSDKSFT